MSPTPGRGKSNAQYFDISSPATQVTMNGLTPYDELGNPDGYGVNLLGGCSRKSAIRGSTHWRFSARFPLERSPPAAAAPRH